MPRKSLDDECEYGSLVMGDAIRPPGTCSAHGRSAVLTEARRQVNRGINARFTFFFLDFRYIIL
jgi:hypothetical protein